MKRLLFVALLVGCAHRQPRPVDPAAAEHRAAKRARIAAAAKAFAEMPGPTRTSCMSRASGSTVYTDCDTR